MSKLPVFTYQTRLRLTDEQAESLDAYAALHGRAQRSSQFFLLGSKDETSGNQSCQAVAASDGSLRLRLRLPDGSGGPSKHLVLEDVHFAHGQEAILQALSASRIVTAPTKTGKLVRKREGSAVSYRFVRDREGGRLFASVEAQPIPLVTLRLAGGGRADPQWTVHAHLRPTREESGEAGMVVLVGRPEKAQSGACPVGRQPFAFRASAPKSAGIRRYPGFAGEIPAREASAALFGRRPG
ncbi:MAG: hypothetical protein PHP75_02235 [Methylacidiphilaceae bacterium]|nr:hypothetical protein [Candidatus Methylacidiphilaceae bacterium]